MYTGVDQPGFTRGCNYLLPVDITVKLHRSASTDGLSQLKKGLKLRKPTKGRDDYAQAVWLSYVNWHLSVLWLQQLRHVNNDNLWRINERYYRHAKKILIAPPPEDWKRPYGHPQITWIKTVLDSLKSHSLTLTEAVNMVRYQPLWRLLATNGLVHS